MTINLYLPIYNMDQITLLTLIRLEIALIELIGKVVVLRLNLLFLIDRRKLNNFSDGRTRYDIVIVVKTYPFIWVLFIYYLLKLL